MDAQGAEDATAIAVNPPANIGVDRKPLLDLTGEQDVEAVGLVLGFPEGKDVERLIEILVDIGRNDRNRLGIQGEIVAFLDGPQDAVSGARGLGARGRSGRRRCRRGALSGPIASGR